MLLTTDNWINAGMVAVILGGNYLMFYNRRKDDATALLTRTKTEATTDATDKAVITSIHVTMAQMQTTLNNQETNFHKHEMECARDKAIIRTDITDIKGDVTEIKSGITNINHQITNLALGSANRTATLDKFP